jgi:hypothetical protein
MLVCLNTHGASQPWQKTAFITNSFFEVALGSEYGNAALKVRKWDRPLRIFVEHQVSDKALHNALLNAQLKDLRRITKLDIRRVKIQSQANIRYYFTSQKKLPALVQSVSGKGTVKHLNTAVCLATIRTGKNGSIQSAAVFIPVDQARMHAKLVSCIVEEITQVLGLPRDSDAVFPSIFNDRSTNDYLTGLDVVLLKILYNPKIKTGMMKSTLKPLLKNIIAAMRVSGEIQQSTQVSRSLALCEFIDC